MRPWRLITVVYYGSLSVYTQSLNEATEAPSIRAVMSTIRRRCSVYEILAPISTTDFHSVPNVDGHRCSSKARPGQSLSMTSDVVATTGSMCSNIDSTTICLR